MQLLENKIIMKTQKEQMLYERYIKYIRYDIPITQFVIDNFKRDLLTLNK